MKAHTTRIGIIGLITTALTSTFGCPIEEDCPKGVALNGSELPCACEGATIDALPGNGAECSCVPGEGFVCDAPGPLDCEYGTVFTGDELPCLCEGQEIDALPGTGECACVPGQGFVCSVTCNPELGDDCDPEPDECALDVFFTGDGLPCLCNGETIDALPGDGSLCWCHEADGFVCESVVS